MPTERGYKRWTDKEKERERASKRPFLWTTLASPLSMSLLLPSLLPPQLRGMSDGPERRGGCRE